MIYFNLKNILNKENLSQNKFAKDSGVRPNTINDIVNNYSQRLEIKTLNKIVQELTKYGYTISDFILYTEEKKNG